MDLNKPDVYLFYLGANNQYHEGGDLPTDIEIGSYVIMFDSIAGGVAIFVKKEQGYDWIGNVLHQPLLDEAYHKGVMVRAKKRAFIPPTPAERRYFFHPKPIKKSDLIKVEWKK